MNQESRVRLLYIEAVAIVADQDISLVEYPPKGLTKRLVAFLVAGVPREVRQCVGLYALLVSPLDRKRKHVPIAVCADDVGFVVLPNVSPCGGRLDIE